MEAIHVLLEGTPKDVDIDELRSTMEKVPGVKSLRPPCMVANLWYQCDERPCCLRSKHSA